MYKREVFAEWLELTKAGLRDKRKKAKQVRKQNRIVLKEGFYQWQLFVKIQRE